MPDAGLGALLEAAGPALGEAAGSLGAGVAGEAVPLFTQGAGEALGPAASSLTVNALGEAAGPSLGALGFDAAAGAAGGLGGALQGLDRLDPAALPGMQQPTSATISPDTMTSLVGPQSPTANVADVNPAGVTSTPPVTPMGGVSASSVSAPAGVGGGIDLTSLLKSGKDWLGPAAAAGGLGYSLLKGQQDLPSTTALKTQTGNLGQQAAALSATGNQYAGYLASGTLPPAMQAQVDQQTRDAKAALVSRAASMGLPTDPLKNSTLQMELASVDDKARQMTATLGQQLLQGGTSLLGTGANLSGMQDSLLTTLSGIDKSQTDAIGKAIANFAGALGSMGKGNAVKTPAGTVSFSPATA